MASATAAVVAADITVMEEEDNASKEEILSLEKDSGFDRNLRVFKPPSDTAGPISSEFGKS